MHNIYICIYIYICMHIYKPVIELIRSLLKPSARVYNKFLPTDIYVYTYRYRYT